MALARTKHALFSPALPRTMKADVRVKKVIEDDWRYDCTWIGIIIGERPSIICGFSLFKRSGCSELPCVVDFDIELSFRCGEDVYPSSVLDSGSDLSVIYAFGMAISSFLSFICQVFDEHILFAIAFEMSPAQVCVGSLLRMILILIRCRPGSPSDRCDALVDMSVLNSFYLNKASLSETVAKIGARIGITFAFSGTLELMTGATPIFLYEMVCIVVLIWVIQQYQ